MTKFYWEGLSGRGEQLSGSMRAVSREAVVERLRADGILPLPASIAAVDGSLSKRMYGRRRRVRQRHVAILARQLAAMLNAGLPLVETLALLAQRSSHTGLGEIMTDVRKSVEAGMPLAQALGKHPQVFDRLFVNMVAVGETAGALDRVLLQLAVHSEKSLQLRDEIVRALMYPLAVIVVAGGVTAALLLYVIPMFAELFAGFGQALPLPTRIVIGLSELATRWAIPSIAVTVLVIAGGLRLHASPRGRLAIDTCALRVPLVGTIVGQAAAARVTGSLATLLGAGVSILEALAIAATTAGNDAVAKGIETARIAVQGGKSLGDELRASAVLPPLVCQMVAVGERTGALDSMLERAANFCEEEVDRTVAAAMALLEPGIMIAMGIVMGALVISMYLPVFQLGNVL